MYIGRFVIAGPGIGAYRVSSRSFPHRQIVQRDGALAVVPTPDAEPTDNPYVSYHCLRETDEAAVIGNGSHVDPIAEKVDLGYPARDALVNGLLVLDYEKDDYDTPRIGAVVGAESTIVGIVRRDALLVETVDQPTLVATYETDAPESIDINWSTANEAAQGALGLEYEHPVCAAGVTVGDEIKVEWVQAD